MWAQTVALMMKNQVQYIRGRVAEPATTSGQGESHDASAQNGVKQKRSTARQAKQARLGSNQFDIARPHPPGKIEDQKGDATYQ
jgi:hypothetical protein